MSTPLAAAARRRPLARALAAALGLTLAASPVAARRAGAQIPDKFENLKVLPKDISRDSLVQVMRGFSSALGVRCTHCHVAEPAPAGAPAGAREHLVFKADDKRQKRTARFMMRMADSLNRVVLAALPERSDPPVVVRCVTCHHGSPVPQTLADVLAADIAHFGPDSAVAHYRRLRADAVSGRYDLSEGSMNELARTLAERGKTPEALAMLTLNQEFNPGSAAIDLAMAELYLKRGERDAAITHYRVALTKQPDNRQARERLKELGAGQ